LPTTRHCCNLDVCALAQSCEDGHRSLVTPKRVLSEYNEFDFFPTSIASVISSSTRKKFKKIY